MTPRAKVLLTGFGPFPGVRENISGLLVRRLAADARTAMPNVRFIAAILPTEWVTAPNVLAGLYDRHDPILALHFGVAPNMRGFRIETEARNVCRMSPDAAGVLPAASNVMDETRSQRAATLDVTAISARLQEQGYCVSLSSDAGGYLCNTILYHSLALAERHGGRCNVGFVHIPSDAPATDVLNALVPGAVQILMVALDAHSPASILTSA
jgi:pyroglutamyl-peptidase